MEANNQLDPITNLPTKSKPVNPFSNLKATSATPTKYDTEPVAGELINHDDGLSRSNLPFRDYLRADNQSNLAAMGSTVARLTSIIPETIQNLAVIEDFFGSDNERGNALYDAMEAWKQGMNELAPIYSRPDQFINMEDISSLVNSAGSFVITGLGTGAALSWMGKAGKLGEALSIGANATILNRMEAHKESIPVYKQAYEDALKSINPTTGKANTREEAMKIADSAADVVEWVNWLNLPLNLTSAASLIKGVNRPFKELMKEPGKGALKNLTSESFQEAGEEYINFAASEAGRRQGENLNKGTNQDVYQFVDDFFTKENAKSMVLGFLGGFAQTGISEAVSRLDTSWYKGKYVEEKAQYKRQ